MLYFPDEGHWVLKPQNSQLWYKTVNAWCDRWTQASVTTRSEGFDGLSNRPKKPREPLTEAALFDYATASLGGARKQSRS